MGDKRQPRKKGAAPLPAAPITDARFASFNTDPRFRLPSRRHTKTTVDKRFAHMFTDADFTSKARVDRWNRKLGKKPGESVLRRLYQEEGEHSDQDKDQDSDRDEDQDEDAEIDDEAIRRELRDANYDPARQGGYSSSSDSDSDSDSGSDSQSQLGHDEEVRGPGRLEANVETGDVTRRIAIVNMDWDHIKSADLMALFSSFVEPASGRIEKISIYPSEFGKERMRREEVEGPPRQVFKPGSKKKKTTTRENAKDDDDDDEPDTDGEDEDERIRQELVTEGADEDFDHNTLRSYQLDRLRYYYAVMTCSHESVAQKLYEATDGSEFQSSSNFLDLRFVPDHVTFDDDEPRDECDRIPDSYKPVEFVTNALQSSKVKLTWDMDPDELTRKESIKRAFTGSRAELDENDLKAYLASDSDDDGDEEPAEPETETVPRLSRQELARRRMRQALGLSPSHDDEKKKKKKTTRDGPVGDMQVTFTAALTGKENKKEADKEETTIEKYKRKERERKEKKRDMARAKRQGGQGANPDGLSEPDEDAGGPQEDLGFDDPFFTTAADDGAPVKQTTSSQRKEERRRKREAREAAEAENAEQRAKMERIMAEHDDEVGDAERLDHFDMNEILRAEKRKAKDKRGKSKAAAAAEPSRELQEGFRMDVDDDRFRAVFEDHDFAIDPSNPRFKPTPGMKQLLEEARKKRKGRDDADAHKQRPEKRARPSQDTATADLKGLVASVKRKAGQF